jgi:hypothetical protein
MLKPCSMLAFSPLTQALNLNRQTVSIGSGLLQTNIAMLVLNQITPNSLDNAKALSAYTDVDVVVFNKDKLESLRIILKPCSMLAFSPLTQALNLNRQTVSIGSGLLQQ